MVNPKHATTKILQLLVVSYSFIRVNKKNEIYLSVCKKIQNGFQHKIRGYFY